MERHFDMELGELKQKLLKRASHKNDKRINLVCLTDAGKALQDKTLELANQTMDEALNGVKKDDIEIVKNVLQRVYDNLNTPNP